MYKYVEAARGNNSHYNASSGQNVSLPGVLLLPPQRLFTSMHTLEMTFCEQDLWLPERHSQRKGRRSNLQMRRTLQKVSLQEARCQNVIFGFMRTDEPG